MSKEMSDALVLLLGGFVVVFAMLILLILIVTVYGRVVSSVQKSVAEKKAKEQAAIQSEEQAVGTVADVSASAEEISEIGDGEISGEIIAVIAAAVDAVYGEKPHRVKSVRRSNHRSAWGRAGIVENTRPF